MNAERRKQIEALRQKISEALSEAESIRDEEQDCARKKINIKAENAS